MAEGWVSEGGISRRHVVQSALWLAPAVVVAQALPAAVSSVVLGIPSVFPGPWTMADLIFTQLLGGTVTVANFAPTGAAAVDDVTLVISVPLTRVGTGQGQVQEGPGWSYLSRADTGTDALFTFLWTGSLEVGASTDTLTARLPKKDVSTLPFEISLQASGTSNSLNVEGGAVPVTVLDR